MKAEWKKVALRAGELMLKNGGETFRVEEIMKYLLIPNGFDDVEGFVTPTGIFLTIVDDDGNSDTYIKRISQRTINLSKINELNSLSRGVTAGNIGLQEAKARLDEIESSKTYSIIARIIASAITASLFTMLFGGSVLDALSTSIIALVMQSIVVKLDMLKLSFFLTNVAGGVISSLLALIFVSLGFGHDKDYIIIGSIMTLVPGVAITNSIRDFFHGDLISGLARMAEAVFVAIAIASGVGVVLKVWFHFLIGG